MCPHVCAWLCLGVYGWVCADDSVLDLSYNQFTNLSRLSVWESVAAIDLSNNLFTGPLPIPDSPSPYMDITTVRCSVWSWAHATLLQPMIGQRGASCNLN